MFEEFLYTLRRGGLKVSLTEWMSLMEALDKGLHRSSFTGFYYLCRCLLVKSEADFDRFDRCFLQYFRDVPFEGEVSQELLDWLDRPDVLSDYANWDEEQARLNELLSEEDIEKMLQERMQEQNEEHNGGNYWVGTHGMSTFGNSGLSPKGIRVGGQGMHRRAFRVAGERKFRDFRKDNTLDTRQFQVALKRLRQYSGLVELPPTEFDVDNTIQDTAEKGGMLTVRYKRPRQNTVKVLLLMDSGGSMDYYAQLCSALFQAVSKVGHFKDLKVYYFHNCIYESVYRHPRMRQEDRVETEWLLKNFDGVYKVIVVGDAAMNPGELLSQQYDWKRRVPMPSGLEWLQRIRAHFPYLIWLNPEPLPAYAGFWGQTHVHLAKLFPMYPLSVEGLESGMHRLMVK